MEFDLIIIVGLQKPLVFFINYVFTVLSHSLSVDLPLYFSVSVLPICFSLLLCLSFFVSVPLSPSAVIFREVSMKALQDKYEKAMTTIDSLEIEKKDLENKLYIVRHNHNQGIVRWQGFILTQHHVSFGVELSNVLVKYV